MSPDPATIAHRHQVRLACRKALAAQPRTASRIDKQAFTNLAEAFIEKDAGVANILRQVTKLLKMLKRAPRALDRIKEMVGDLTLENLRKWASDGKRALGAALQRAAHAFPLGIFFHPKARLVTLTDLMNRILDQTQVGEFLRTKVKPKIDSFDKLLKQHVPNLRRPLLAAIFIFVWLNVAELSWDFESLMVGFTGGLALSDLLASLPESALGFLMKGFGLGFHALPVILVARLLWLVAQNYIEWDKARGEFKVHWNLLGAFEPATR